MNKLGVKSLLVTRVSNSIRYHVGYRPKEITKTIKLRGPKISSRRTSRGIPPLYAHYQGVSPNCFYFLIAIGAQAAASQRQFLSRVGGSSLRSGPQRGRVQPSTRKKHPGVRRIQSAIRLGGGEPRGNLHSLGQSEGAATRNCIRELSWTTQATPLPANPFDYPDSSGHRCNGRKASASRERSGCAPSARRTAADGARMKTNAS